MTRDSNMLFLCKNEGLYHGFPHNGASGRGRATPRDFPSTMPSHTTVPRTLLALHYCLGLEQLSGDLLCGSFTQRSSLSYS